MDTKHTPGPWTVRYDYVVQASSFDDGRLVPVAQPYGLNADGTDLFANARLIAAAPELLDLLIKARRYVGMVTEIDANDPIFGLMDDIDAAIAKARGE